MDTDVLIDKVYRYGTGGLAEGTVDELLKILDKHVPAPPEHKVHPKYTTLGKNYYCGCGVMFVDFERNGTNYCGNCGQKLK